ncbi:uncharacterized protein LOC131953497 [Physella acuta]|uniref:uncharacterized protein LOC131953497 n=1 Tax=Physella acuta TaxID=109671 RepID=UPI0027DDCEEA|nr:uncharacterized protein LOC131953497 [Physella acuta]
MASYKLILCLLLVTLLSLAYAKKSYGYRNEDKSHGYKMKKYGEERGYNHYNRENHYGEKSYGYRNKEKSRRGYEEKHRSYGNKSYGNKSYGNKSYRNDSYKQESRVYKPRYNGRRADQ